MQEIGRSEYLFSIGDYIYERLVPALITSAMVKSYPEAKNTLQLFLLKGMGKCPVEGGLNVPICRKQKNLLICICSIPGK